MTEIDAIVKLLNAGGTAAVISGLCMIVAGVLRGWWVPGRYYDQLKSERDEALAGWRSMLQEAHRSNLSAERALRSQR